MNPNPRTDMSTTEIPTPLTDAAEYTNFNGAQVTPYVDAEMARDLERRLHAALAREQALRGVLELVKKKWTFSANQMHTHTWHDWADCIVAIESALSTTPTA
jgi:regulator of sirC expression with transglutaminase-like and TPR domain